MKDTMTSLLSDKKCKNKPVLLSVIKDLIADKPYNKDLMTISVTNTGPHAAREYYRLSCRTRESDPELLKANAPKTPRCAWTKSKCIHFNSKFR